MCYSDYCRKHADQVPRWVKLSASFVAYAGKIVRNSQYLSRYPVIICIVKQLTVLSGFMCSHALLSSAYILATAPVYDPTELSRANRVATVQRPLRRLSHVHCHDSIHT